MPELDDIEEKSNGRRWRKYSRIDIDREINNNRDSREFEKIRYHHQFKRNKKVLWSSKYFIPISIPNYLNPPTRHLRSLSPVIQLITAGRSSIYYLILIIRRRFELDLSANTVHFPPPFPPPCPPIGHYSPPHICEIPCSRELPWPARINRPPRITVQVYPAYTVRQRLLWQFHFALSSRTANDSIGENYYLVLPEPTPLPPPTPTEPCCVRPRSYETATTPYPGYTVR